MLERDLNTMSDATNPYKPPALVSGGPTPRLRRWLASLWPTVGSVAGLILLAILTGGAKATVAMTVKHPRDTVIFFAIFSLASFLAFTFWKAMRSLVSPVLDAGPFLRVVCGFVAIFMFLPGIYVMRQAGILNVNEYYPAYNWSLIVAHGVLSIATPVEIEQYLAARRFRLLSFQNSKIANNPMDRSGGSTAS